MERSTLQLPPLQRGRSQTYCLGLLGEMIAEKAAKANGQVPSPSPAQMSPGRRRAVSTSISMNRLLFTMPPDLRAGLAERERGQVNARSEDQLAPLDRKWCLMVIQGKVPEVEQLLTSQPGLTDRRDFVSGFAAIHWAAKLGNMELLRVLLRFDCKVDMKTNSGNTALHLACHHGKDNVAKALLVANASCLVRNNVGKLAIDVSSAKLSPATKDMLHEKTVSAALQYGKRAKTKAGTTAETQKGSGRRPFARTVRASFDDTKLGGFLKGSPLLKRKHVEHVDKPVTSPTSPTASPELPRRKVSDSGSPRKVSDNGGMRKVIGNGSERNISDGIDTPLLGKAE